MANCKNTQQLNITCGTDVVLHDKLMFDGEIFDPNISVNIECNLVNSLGKRTSLEYEIADETLIIQIPWVDGRNAGCYGLDVKGKCNGKTWATYADSLIRYTRATVEGAAVVETEHDLYDVTQVVSYRYSDSPLDEVDATIDDNYGEPEVTTTYEHNKLTLDFKNLRGNGIANVEQTIESLEPEGVNETTITQDNGDTNVIRVRNGKSIVGPSGPQGASAVFDPDTGNILATLENTTGMSDSNAMTQKAVTSELVSVGKKMGEYDNECAADLTDKDCCIPGGTHETWAHSSSIGTAHIALPVTPGEKILVKPTTTLNYGWCAFVTSAYGESTPANGDPIPYVSGTNLVTYPKGKESLLTVPDGAAFLVMNRVNGSGVETNWEVWKHEDKNISAEIKAITGLTKVSFTDDFHGHIDYKNGTKILGENKPTNYVRKFPISNTNLIYYADLRTFPTADVYPAGVAYFDTNNVFICAQYFRSGTVVELRGVKLQIPQNAAYCYILGAIENETYGRPVPQLYVASPIEQSQKVNRHYTEIGSVVALGSGSTLLSTVYFNSKPNQMYRIVAEYGTWTMPDPTSNTAAFCVYDWVESAQFNKVFLQNNFSWNGDLEFITSPYSEKFKLALRATEGESIKFTIYEVSIDKEFVDERKTAAKASANGFLYNTTKVKGLILDNGINSNTEIDETEIDSAWAVIFPSTYSQSGKPTQVIAMLHGAVGYVSPTVMGYDGETWTNWRDLYLQHGFAVMDINGWGVSTESDGKSKHWGCPPALETIDKAFDELKAKYNVADKLMLHGSSMGGATAWAYGLTRPNKVLAMGLFSAATISYKLLVDRPIYTDYATVLASWQYADKAAAISDDYSRIVGYDPILRALRYKDGLLSPIETLAGHDVIQYAEAGNEYVLVGQPLPFPVRMWHGTSDVSVPYQLSEIVANAYRLGGQNVTIRLCPGLGHNICTGSTQYVLNESVDFFEMYSR